MAIIGDIPPDQRDRAAAALPGIRPVGQADWITVDASYAAQMAARRQLLKEQREAVYQMRPAAEGPAAELLQEVLVLLRARPDFAVEAAAVVCPDGQRVAFDSAPPLVVLGQILQEDLCVHVAQGDAHHLMGAVLCFPASWTLAEKIGKPLVRIHAPVADYDAALAARVQRLFDGVQVGQPLWRANHLVYEDPTLFQPRREGDQRPISSETSRYARSERQTVLRLPQSRAVVFAIHTVVAEIGPL